MADPTSPGPGQAPSSGGAPAPTVAFMPVLLTSPPFLLLVPIVLPPPPPAPPVALTTDGTVSDPEGAATTYKDIPARALTLDQANAVLLDLKSQGALTVRPANILGLPSLSWGVTVGSFKVRKPAQAGQPPPPWTAFEYGGSEPVDPRLAVLLHRLATHLHVEHGATGMKTMGTRRSSERPELSCHNQGRALDFSGVLWGQESITVHDHWGALPLRLDGEVVHMDQDKHTKKYDKGAVVLGKKAIGQFVSRYSKRAELKQERLNPNIEVDAAILQSVLEVADPGPKEQWSEQTKKTAAELQEKLRRAAKVFLSLFDFFVRESTVDEGAKAFTKDPLTEVFHKPITRINSGNICCPDGTSWDGHQNHFHVQIGVTKWAERPDSTSSQDPASIDATVKKFLYDRSAKGLVDLLDKIYAGQKQISTAENAAFAKEKRLAHEPDMAFEDSATGKKHARRAAIAAAFTDERLKRRIETFDAPALQEISPKDLREFHTRRGRVLRDWYWGLKNISLAPLDQLAADESVPEAAARERLYTVVDAELTRIRDATIAAEDK